MALCAHHIIMVTR